MKLQRRQVLVAEDDPDDRLLLKEAFAEKFGDEIPLQFVNDGVELIDHLIRLSETNGPLPSVILLDINMPRMNGLQALERIKAHSRMKTIPCAMLSTSNSPEMVNLAYQLGASSYFQKPATFQQMIELAGVIQHSWLSLPHNMATSARAISLNYFNKE